MFRSGFFLSSVHINHHLSLPWLWHSHSCLWILNVVFCSPGIFLSLCLLTSTLLLSLNVTIILLVKFTLLCVPIKKQRYYIANKCPSSQGYGFSSSHVLDVRVGLWRKLSAEELMLLNCGVGEDSWESLGVQGDPTSPFWRKSALGFLWKEWC